MKSGGYAVISSTMHDMRHTRPTFFSSYFPPCCGRSIQAALAHLESIIYDPHDLTSQHAGVDDDDDGGEHPPPSDSEEDLEDETASTDEKTLGAEEKK